jgi:hypothetical protein
MKRFVRGATEVWVGIHPKMGVLIYDPRAQVAVAQNKVRLFVWSEQRMATFLKSIVRNPLASENTEATDVGPLKDSAEFYFGLQGRFTHCYKCKRDLNSIDFEVCKVCRWIKCECAACGCGYRGPS